MGCECQDVTREMDDPGRSNEPKTSVGLKGGAEVGAEDLARDERESCITWVRGDQLADAWSVATTGTPHAYARASRNARSVCGLKPWWPVQPVYREDELPEELLASWCRLCAQILEQKRAKGAVA